MLAKVLKLEAYNKNFGQCVGTGRVNLVEKWPMSTSGVILIHGGCDLLNKNNFTQNEL